VLNSCFFIFAKEIIFLTSIQCTVKTKKNCQICRFLTESKYAFAAMTWCCSDL